MAEGCNLHLDRKDLEDVKATIGGVASKSTRQQARAAARDMLASALNRPAILRQILSTPGTRNYMLAKASLEAALAVENAPHQEREKLMPALEQVLKSHSKLPGMFEKLPKYRGPGSAPMTQHYELTSTARLSQLGDANKSFKTSTGVDIAIRPQDNLSFGYKFAGNYALSTKGEGTVESDTTIHRGERNHAIDQKYTTKVTRDLASEKGFDKSVKRAASALRDGQTHSYSFITNAKFSSTTKERVFRENCRIVKALAARDGALEQRLMAKSQDISTPISKINVESNETLEGHREMFKEIVEKNAEKLPLIGIAEGVRFSP
ncbi:MAG: hypothetical protein ABW141_20130 [Candidatus Thiodiazotropha endolucinida]